MKVRIRKEAPGKFRVEAWNREDRIRVQVSVQNDNEMAEQRREFWIEAIGAENVGPIKMDVDYFGNLNSRFFTDRPIWKTIHSCSTLLDAKIYRIEYLKNFRKNEK